MKRKTIYGILFTLCAIGGIWLLLMYKERYFVSPTFTFTTMEQVAKEDFISKGWLPGFMPPSAYNIREIFNSEQNTVVAVFSFDSSDHFVLNLHDAVELELKTLKVARVPTLGRMARWFSRQIAAGKYEQLASEGFKFYKIQDARAGKTDNWYLAVHQNDGKAYLWN